MFQRFQSLRGNDKNKYLFISKAQQVAGNI